MTSIKSYYCKECDKMFKNNITDIHRKSKIHIANKRRLDQYKKFCGNNKKWKDYINYMEKEAYCRKSSRSKPRKKRVKRTRWTDV